ncbi:membrane hypothetical protein [Bradyrhizobium sp. ORS 375]|uniref:hypothetical protein n=1 Tax=Bradyrhizobium sp. (strain ORS 375) TaxID=566679 RepID=UPI0002409650|nr:hypothetical protein [Bradyrhizobium sp. ORS 375]CCD92766.1 membrane hypothetical protein [Bradyrhizobium sp. ORS 375]
MMPAATIGRLGAVILLAGFALLLWPSQVAFAAASFVGAAIGLVVLYVSIDGRDQMRISWLLATALLLAYDGGSVSTYLNAGSAQEFAILTKDRPIEAICAALALVHVICGLLLLVGRWEASTSGGLADTTTDGWFSLLLACGGLGLIVLGYVFGDLGYMGIQTDEAGRVSVIGAAASLIEGPLAGVAGYLTVRARQPLSRLFYAVVVMLVTLAVVPTGRRAILLVLLVATIGFALGGGLRRLSLGQKAAAVAVGGVFAYVTSSYFFALRLATWELGNGASLPDQLSLGLEFMMSSSLKERFSTLFYDNVRERTFVLGYLSDLIEAVGSSGPLYGDALEYYLRLCIPSVLDPNKDQIIAYQMVETLVHPKLGLPVIDEANTILTDGVTDFGLAGAFVYAASLVALMRGAIWAIQRLGSPITVMFGTFTVISLVLKPELTLDEYLVPLRNLAAFIPLMWIAEAMPSLSRGGSSGTNTPPRKLPGQWPLRSGR